MVKRKLGDSFPITIFPNYHITTFPSYQITIQGKTLFAIIIKELRVYVRSRRMRNIQIVYVCLLSLTLFFIALELSAQSRLNFDHGKMMFSTFFVVASLLLVCLVTPISANSAITEEKKEANIDFLWLTPIRRKRIIAGKLVASTLYAMVMLASCLPLLCLSVYTGGLSLRAIVLCYLLLLITVITFNLIGIFWALVCQCAKPSREVGTGNEARAIALSYATVCALIFVPLFASTFTQGIGASFFMEYGIQAFSSLYAILTVLNVVSSARMLGLPLWCLTVIVYVLISVVVFYIIITKNVRLL